MSGPSKNFQPINNASEKTPKRSLVASSSGRVQHKVLKHIVSPKSLSLVKGPTGQLVFFLLKVAALEAIRRLSRARCPSVWRVIQSLPVLCYPPFRWIQRWGPLRILVAGLQKFSRPVLFLSIATAISDQSEDCQKAPDGVNDSELQSVPPPSTPDMRDCEETPVINNSIASENWFLKLLEELDKQGIALPERINEDELRRFYSAANGDFSCLLSSVKRTIRWRKTYHILSFEELEMWSHLVFWHGFDVKLRPCLVLRLGVACSSLMPSDRPRFAQAVVSQIEYGVLHLINERDPYITVLMDCEGLSPFKFPMQMLRSCSTLVQEHYPDRLGTLFVIRLPPVVRVIAQTFIQVKENYKLYIDMSLERLRLLVDAFCADDNIQKDISTSQAKFLTTICTKLIRKVKFKQVNMNWEMPLFKALGHVSVPSDVLEGIELPLKGMEIALASMHLPINTSQHQLNTHMVCLREYIRLKHKGCEDKQEMIDITQQTLDSIIPQKQHDLPSLHFLFCMRLLYNSHLASPTKKVTPTSCKEEPPKKKKAMRHWCPNLELKRLVVALKCSISLGLAVLFGLLFSKQEGIWSGLIVAFALAPCREATFRLANIRAQGTALGTVYGVLGSLVSQKFMEARFLILLAWIIFASFLCRSRMYGHAGGMAANISVMFILGRRNYGSPTTFAIARLTEAFIGLSCFICAELLLQPKRAPSLARAQLSECLRTLHECVEPMVLKGSVVHLEESRQQLRHKVDKLMKYIAESEGEPDFWFMPFPTSCYKKLHLSLSQIVYLVHFLSQGLKLLAEVSQEETIHGDLESFRRAVCSSVECLKEAIHVKSIASLEKEMERKGSLMDVEQGKTKRLYGNNAPSVCDEEGEKIVASFLQHTKEWMESVDADHTGEELKGHVVLCLGAVGFCMEGLIRETRELEKGILELVQWENPARKIDLYEISCKAKELLFKTSS